ncbi:hypothetical protein J2S00_001029 [Caldalkalibacillus uzonensis]|uniref:RsgI N-terminal anti-sigma domain-containing protein n=1 Tax=Caldalkalibacillus uzonensis TaxID=353224 RepID=A0ABU0CP98_9BACI|nr:anti-sigma factor domain-containing protein [Caldalkalibacillus uzonensis]MDQ0338245.1 hypothetical protein [Caldalkalibacillus uzonensis]
MAKGIVLEIKETEAIVMTNEGTFHAIRKRKEERIQIGDEVELPASEMVDRPIKRRFHIPTIALVASCLILFLTLIGYMALGPDHTAVAYVHLDLNPSVEMSVNKSMEVLTLKGLNPEGQRLVEYMEDWSHRSLHNVIVNMLIMAQDQGYLQDVTDVLVTTSAVGDRDILDYEPQIVTALLEAEAQLIQSDSFYMGPSIREEQFNEKEIELTSVSASNNDSQSDQSYQGRYLIFYQVNTNQDIRRKAQDVGLSPGKYMIYLYALEQKLDLDLEDIQERSVSELARDLGGLGQVLSRSLSEAEPQGESNKQTEQPQPHTNGQNKPQKNNFAPDNTLPEKMNDQDAPGGKEEIEEEELERKESISSRGNGELVSAHLSKKRNEFPPNGQDKMMLRPVQSDRANSESRSEKKNDDKPKERKQPGQIKEQHNKEKSDIKKKNNIFQQPSTKEPRSAVEANYLFCAQI